MGIILREAAHTQQAMQHPALLVAIDRSQLRHAHRQLAVGALVGLVDLDVEGAVHRLDVVIAAVDIHRRKHVLAVEFEMPRPLPQHAASDMRGVDQLVAAAIVLAAPEILDG